MNVQEHIPAGAIRARRDGIVIEGVASGGEVIGHLPPYIHIGRPQPGSVVIHQEKGFFSRLLAGGRSPAQRHPPILPRQGHQVAGWIKVAGKDPHPAGCYRRRCPLPSTDIHHLYIQ